MAPEVPRYAYGIMSNKLPPERIQNYWESTFEDFCDEGDVEWEQIHIRNFKCTIETQLRSFYFKLFYKAIAFNSFLYKIGRKDSPLCFFCNESPETVVHVFCECDKIKPIWKDLLALINDKLHENYNFDGFNMMFGIEDDVLLSFLILCCKYYIYKCRFQEVSPNFTALKNFILSKRNVEYNIARKKGKLTNHFKKWSFDL